MRQEAKTIVRITGALTIDTRGAAIKHAVDPAQAAASAPTAERQWQTVVWDDPVNLMSYVAYVFESYFGFPDAEAERLMLQVHHEGSAVVAEGSRDAMELHVEAMHGYGLWATVREGGTV